MSWSEQIAPTSLEALRERAPVTQFAADADDQYIAARAAAVAVIESGALGDPATHQFAGFLAGHANPDHEMTEGYANDCVSISIGQVNQS